MLCLKDSSNSQAHHQNFWQLTVVTCFYPSSNLPICSDEVQIAITLINRQFNGHVVVGPLSILCSYHAGIICSPLDFVYHGIKCSRSYYGWNATSSLGRLLPRDNFHRTIQQLPLCQFPVKGKCQTLDRQVTYADFRLLAITRTVSSVVSSSIHMTYFPVFRCLNVGSL